MRKEGERENRERCPHQDVIGPLEPSMKALRYLVSSLLRCCKRPLLTVPSYSTGIRGQSITRLQCQVRFQAGEKRPAAYLNLHNATPDIVPRDWTVRFYSPNHIR